MVLSLFCFSCDIEKNKTTEFTAMESLNPFQLFDGDFDNFQQHWKQNTDEDLHRDKSPIKHEHVHVKFKKVKDLANAFDVGFYKGRNNSEFVKSQRWLFSHNDDGHWNLDIDGHGSIILNSKNGAFESEDGGVYIKGDTLKFNGLGVFPTKDEVPYTFVRCRYFSGWLQCPYPDDPDSLYSQRDLQIHDQGGMVELDFEGIDYTAELTQLVYGHKIKIMKLAIYDMPLAEVGINSKSISYTWSNPEAKRLGINLRKIISGWTLIEEGYVNSNNLNKKKETENNE